MDGKFSTYCSTRGESVTDYLLFNMFDTLCISDFDILEYTCFSDHAALFFSFETLPLHGWASGELPRKCVNANLFPRHIRELSR